MELNRVKADLSASLDLMVQHRLWVQGRLERAVAAARGVHEEVVGGGARPQGQ